LVSFCAKECVVWRAFVEGGLRPFAVVEPYPVIDVPLGLETVIDLVQVDGFLLYGSPKPLDEGVVQIAAPPIYNRRCIGNANVTRGIEVLISGFVNVVIQSAPVY